MLTQNTTRIHSGKHWNLRSTVVSRYQSTPCKKRLTCQNRVILKSLQSEDNNGAEWAIQEAVAKMVPAPPMWTTPTEKGVLQSSLISKANGTWRRIIPWFCDWAIFSYGVLEGHFKGAMLVLLASVANHRLTSQVTPVLFWLTLEGLPLFQGIISKANQRSRMFLNIPWHLEHSCSMLKSRK